MIGRPLIPFDMLVSAVRSRTHKVTVATIHPDDVDRVPLDLVSNLIGGVPIVQSHTVRRGELFVETIPTRR